MTDFDFVINLCLIIAVAVSNWCNLQLRNRLAKNREEYWGMVDNWNTAISRLIQTEVALSEVQSSHRYTVEREKLARDACQVIWDRWRSGEKPPSEEYVPTLEDVVASSPKAVCGRNGDSRGAEPDVSYNWYGL